MSKKGECKPKQKRESDSEESFQVFFFKEEDGSVPLLAWLDSLKSPEAVARCMVVIELLNEFRNNLRRPHADALRDGIRELRAKHRHVQFRMLYFFHKRSAIITHGFFKTGGKVPPKEIDRAIAYRKQFQADPKRHTYIEVKA